MTEVFQRRRHQRVEATLPVRIATIDPEKDPWTGMPYFRSLQETCGNVSRGGAFVETSESFDLGRRVLVELHLPSGEQLEAIGRIAWTQRVIADRDGAERPAGVGVEFLGGASDHFAALDAFLTDCETRGEEADD